ncbi:MAG: PilZ domain-containing protein [Spirochaetales bacterium]|nr:PilZ domain-containing protein [Spirochaetales bacterium]
MPKKPWIILLVSLCYIVSPFFILLQASIITNYPIIGFINIFQKLSIFDWILLAIYFIAAVSIFSVKKWGWYCFIVASILLVASNSIIFILRPYYAAGALVAYNLIISVAAGIFFRRELIAPYFNPQIRWWTQAPRYSIEYTAEIGYKPGRISAEILDISETGIFVITEKPLEEHTPYPMCIRCAGYRILVDAKVVRMKELADETLKKGYGMKFIHISAIEKKALSALILRLEKGGMSDTERLIFEQNEKKLQTSPRFVIQTSALMRVNNKTHGGKLKDISATGCLLKVPGFQTLSPGLPVHLTLSCFSRLAEINGIVCWLKNEENTALAGIVFTDPSKKTQETVKCIINAGKTAGAQLRLKTARPLPMEKIEEYALNSPYKIIHGVKKKVLKR